MSSLAVNISPYFESLSLLDSLKHRDCNHATHCMLYSTPDSNGISYALLQMRFDGLIGFVGGGVDVEDVTIDHIIDAMNRELDEEINYPFESVTQSEWICSHRDTDQSRSFVQHFFAKELSLDQLLQIGKTHVKAHHFPIESLGMSEVNENLLLIEYMLGLIYVPISGTNSKSSTFLSNFLRQKFAGNGRQQFIESLRKRKLLSDKQIFELQDISQSQESNHTKGREVNAMIITDTAVHYYDETVDVLYGLMIIRNNGLFDFIATNLIDNHDTSLMIETITDSLRRDLGSYSQLLVSEKDLIKLNVNNDSSYMFCTQLNSTLFTQIETNFTETENFNKISFGVFRIPFQLKGNTEKADNYVNRFFKGFLCQNFVNNCKNQLQIIHQQIVLKEK